MSTRDSQTRAKIEKSYSSKKAAKKPMLSHKAGDSPGSETLSLSTVAMLNDTGIHRIRERKKKFKRQKISLKHVERAPITSHQKPLVDPGTSNKIDDYGEVKASEKDYEHSILQPHLKSIHVNLFQDNQITNLDHKYSRKRMLSATSKSKSTSKRKSRDANQECTTEISTFSSPKSDKTCSSLDTLISSKKGEQDKRKILHQEPHTSESGSLDEMRDETMPEEPDSEGTTQKRTKKFPKGRLEADNLRGVTLNRNRVLPDAVQLDHRSSKPTICSIPHGLSTGPQNQQEDLETLTISNSMPPIEEEPGNRTTTCPSQNFSILSTESAKLYKHRDSQAANNLEANSELSINTSSIGQKPKLSFAAPPLKRKWTESAERLASIKDNTSSSVSKRMKQTSRNDLLKDSIDPGSDKNSFIPATPKVRNSQISVEELNQISNAIDSFRRENNMTQHAVNDLIQKEAKKTDQTKELWLYVSERIPTIPKQKLINLCRRKFHNYEARGAWTAAQDEDLKTLYDQYPNKWTTIGQIINRFPEDCRDRWRNYLVCGDKMRKVAWEFEEEQRLRSAVGEFLKKFHEEHVVADVDDSLLIDWQTISKMMGHSRSRLQCSLKWKVLKDRYESGDDNDSGDSSETKPLSRTPWRLEDAKEKIRAMRAEQKLQLLYAIQVCGSKRESKIPWVQIEKLNPGISGNKLALRLIFKHLKEQVPQHGEKKIPEIVQYLIDAYEAASPNEPKGFNEIETLIEKNRRASFKKRKKRIHRSAPIVYESDISEDLDTQKSPQTNSKHSSVATTQVEEEKMTPSLKSLELSSIQDKDYKAPKESLQSNQDCTFASDNIFLDRDQVTKKRTKPRRTYGRTCKPPLVRAQRSCAPTL